MKRYDLGTVCHRLHWVVLVGAVLTAFAGCDDDGSAEIVARESPSPTEPTTILVPDELPRSTTTTAPPASTTTAAAPSTPTTEPDWGRPLMGRRFVAESAFDGDEPRTFVSDTRPFVRFERRADTDVVSWSGGCNQFGSGVTVRADRLIPSDEFAGTTVGCSPSADAQDDWVTRLIGANPAWQLDHSAHVLTLTAGEQRLILRRA